MTTTDYNYGEFEHELAGGFDSSRDEVNALLHDATVEVVERVARDLSDEHDSDRCDCEMCRWADTQERQSSSDSVQSSFDSLWSRTPLVIQESGERDTCEYFYRMGVVHGREMVLATTNDDLIEMRRLAGERLR